MSTRMRPVGIVVAALASIGLLAGAGAVGAQEDDGGDRPPELTDEEREAHRAAFEEFHACMAEQGVELPERPAGRPGPKEEGEGEVEEAEAPDIDREAAEAAFEACRDLVPPPPGVTQEELDAHRAAFDAYVACMAEQGVEAEPMIPGLGPVGGDEELSEEDRAKAEAAFEQCQELVPPPPGVSAEEFDAHRTALEEFRACLSEQGIETPGRGIPGVPGSHPQNAEPTDEQREQFEAGAVACGELRPELPGGHRPGPGKERPEAPAPA
ncbi:MAG: hypothetical protein ACT4PI_06065 [Actinomycetota bacterium]